MGAFSSLGNSLTCPSPSFTRFIVKGRFLCYSVYLHAVGVSCRSLLLSHNYLTGDLVHTWFFTQRNIATILVTKISSPPRSTIFSCAYCLLCSRTCPFTQYTAHYVLGLVLSHNVVLHGLACQSDYGKKTCPLDQYPPRVRHCTCTQAFSRIHESVLARYRGLTTTLVKLKVGWITPKE